MTCDVLTVRGGVDERCACGDVPTARTLRLAPASTMYSQLLGSVRTTMRLPQWWRMEKLQMRVLR